MQKQQILDLCRLFVDEICEHLEDADMVLHDSGEPEPIETEQRDGFIPYTDGGWGAVPLQYLSLVKDYGGPLAVQETIESSLDDCLEQFRVDHNLPDSWEAVREENQEILEKFYEYEDYWFRNSDDCFFYKIYAMYHTADNGHGSGRDAVTFQLYLNTDYGYGRDYVAWAYGNRDRTSGCKEIVVPVDCLNEQRVKWLAEAMFNRLCKNIF